MRKAVIWVVVFLLVATLFAPYASAYINPILINDNNADLGDPFILKYNGTYYMYPSNYNGYGWKSTDLVNWTRFGKPFTDKNGLNLYAPEVFYSNGYFYCISCSNGTTNYTLRSESPEGPFKTVSGDLGMEIDGSFFRDFDGKIYLTTAGWKLINLYELDSTLTSATPLNDIMVDIDSKWTEGPTIFKRGDTYYITYTGNHVLDYSYRVEWAYSDDGVRSGWVEPDNNLLLFNATGELRGLGHNSIVIGPDLDTYYIVYHNNYIEAGVRRAANIDRISWNGMKPVVTPSYYEVKGPALPDFEERYGEGLDSWKIDGTAEPASDCLATLSGKMLTKESTEDIYTAEFNLIPQNSKIYFSYTNDNNCGRISFDGGKMTVDIIKGGKVVTGNTVTLPSDTDLSVLQNIKVQQTATHLSVFFDGVRKYETEALYGGKIGYEGENITVGYTAFSGVALGSGDTQARKYLPATLEAALANNASELEVIESDKLGNSVNLLSGKTVRFETTASADGTYQLSLYGKSKNGATLGISIDGEPLVTGLYTAPSTSYNYETVANIPLTVGDHTVEIHVLDGSYELYQVVADLSVPVEEDLFEMKTIPPRFRVVNGTARATSGRLKLSQTTLHNIAHCEVVSQTTNYTNYSVSVKIEDVNAKKAGILLRSQSTTAPAQTSDASLNAESYQRAYFVSIEEGKVVLHKYNFSDEILDSKKADVKDGSIIRVDAVGNKISVYVDDKPLFTYTDNDAPYLYGNYGVMTSEGSAFFDDLKISPLNVENTYVNADGTTFTSAEHMNVDGYKLPAKSSNGYIFIIAGVALILAGILVIFKNKIFKRA